MRHRTWDACARHRLRRRRPVHATCRARRRYRHRFPIRCRIPRDPTAHLVGESIAGGYDAPLWRLLAMTYRSMLPHIARLGVAPADVGDPGTVADRLAAAAAAVRAQIVSKPQSCAWVIRP